MAAPSSVRGLAITALVLLLSASTRASALAPRQTNHTASTPPTSDGSGSGDGSDDENLRPWVTVNAQGVAATVTPTVQDGKYTSTFAGDAKTPTASPDGSGAFLVCDEQTGSGARISRFALLRMVRRSSLARVTWDANALPDAGTEIRVMGTYLQSDGDATGVFNQSWLSEDTYPAARGYHIWVPDAQSAPDLENSQVQLSLVYPTETGPDGETDFGPKVFLAIGDDDEDDGSLAGAAPRRRKRRRIRRPTGSTSPRASSRASRSKAQESTDIPLEVSPGFPRHESDFPSGPPAPGRNVFREELARQEGLRRWG
ncbi:unnamed protein product [Parascedosporium putredinis]|uniref:Uncharacterized protein n=1 Tax=Parascedosporium putredinis TaxID=1442378 RepID=A0A9P1HA51_9PEZI|nr:unnamed protein product [Parascedosporium putredinis]CAI8002473.1 unnamed protein product [Parascedosporium putredinis]